MQEQRRLYVALPHHLRLQNTGEYTNQVNGQDSAYRILGFDEVDLFTRGEQPTSLSAGTHLLRFVGLS